MNLARVQKALLAMQRSENRELLVRRSNNDTDVREMVEAGLVNAELSDGSEQSITALRTITEAGYRFLKAFPARYRFCDAH